MAEIKRNIYTLKEKVNSSGDYNVLYPTTVCDAVLDLSGKTLTQVLNTKQDTLVSGTNIVTINGNSLLGSGNLTISGGGGSGASVSSADYSSANTQLNGLNINGTNYKLLDVKENNGQNLIIGANRSLRSGASRATAIGSCESSTASNSNSTALGSNSEASGENSIAIGCGSVVHVPNWVGFDGESDDLVRTVALKSTDNIFFRNQNVRKPKIAQTDYTAGKTLTQVLDTKQDTLVSGTNIKTINGNSLLGSGDVAISDKLVRIYIGQISDEAKGTNSNSLVFVGYRDLINSKFEEAGLDLDTLSANWKTLMTGEYATQIWAGLCYLLTIGYCFGCFYMIDGGLTVSPIMDVGYLGYITLNDTTPVGHVVFNSETAMKTAFANSTMKLDN